MGILRRKYLLQFYTNTHTVCLQNNMCYNFEVTDLCGDGMCTNSGGCGSFELKLNDETKLLNENPNFGSRTSFEVCTDEGDDNDNNTTPTESPTISCIDSTGIVYKKKKTCGKIKKLNKIKKICNTKH